MTIVGRSRIWRPPRRLDQCRRRKSADPVIAGRER